MIDSLAGEMGGIIAGAFASGAVSGYGFAVRTVIAEAKDRIRKLEARAEKLEEQAEELRKSMMPVRRSSAKADDKR